MPAVGSELAQPPERQTSRPQGELGPDPQGSTDSHGTLYWPFKGPIGPQGPQGPRGPMGPMGPQRAPEWNQNGSSGTKMEPKWKFWNQHGTKIGFWEPKFDFWNQNGTKIGFWNQNGTTILIFGTKMEPNFRFLEPKWNQNREIYRIPV